MSANHTLALPDAKEIVLTEANVEAMETQLVNMLAALKLYRHNPKAGSENFRKGFAPFADMFQKLFDSKGKNGYNYDDTLTSEQAVDRYKSEVSKSWANRPEETDPISKSEMEDLKAKMASYNERKLALQDKRVQERQAMIEQQRAMEEARALALPASQNQPQARKKDIYAIGDDDDVDQHIALRSDPVSVARANLRTTYTKGKNQTLEELDDLHTQQKMMLDRSFDSSDDEH